MKFDLVDKEAAHESPIKELVLKHHVSVEEFIQTLLANTNNVADVAYIKSNVDNKIMQHKHFADVTWTTFSAKSLYEILPVLDYRNVSAVASMGLRGDPSIMLNMDDLMLCSYDELNACFIHELTHIEQYMDKRLTRVEGGVRWNGGFFKAEEISFNARELDQWKIYTLLPWELEANNRQIEYLGKKADVMAKTNPYLAVMLENRLAAA